LKQSVQLAKVLDTLQSIQTKFNTAQSTGKLVSIADLVVLLVVLQLKNLPNAGHTVTFLYAT
jgi:catalase-peroxidase